MSGIDAPIDDRPRPGSTRWWLRPAGFGLGVAVALVAMTGGVLLLAGRDRVAQTANPDRPAAWERPVVDRAGLIARTGVQVEHVAVSGGGGLLDLRFRVLDPGKAASIHDPGTPAAIVDERTGVVVNSLLMGHSHTAPFKPGITYYLVFENPGNLVHRGSDVSVLLGDAQIEHVVVE